VTPADEITTAAAKMRTFPGPAAEPIATLLETVLSSAREAAPAHEECDSWCNPQTCDLSAALAVARAINGGEQR